MMSWKWKSKAVGKVQIVTLNAYISRWSAQSLIPKNNTGKFTLIELYGQLCIDLIYSEIDMTLSSLETLAKVFDHPSCSLSHTKAQVWCQVCCTHKLTVEFVKQYLSTIVDEKFK